MGLVPGADGSKAMFKDGIQVNYVDEYTLNAGVHVKGSTDGTAVPTGYIGEVITGYASSVSAVSAGYKSLTSIQFPTDGVYTLFGNIHFQRNSATMSAYSFITTFSSAADVPSINALGTNDNYDDKALALTAFSDFNLLLPSMPVRLLNNVLYIPGTSLTLTNRTLYLTGRAGSFTGGPVLMYGFISALRNG